MTTQYAVLESTSGQATTSTTLRMRLFAINGDTVLYTSDTVVERTNAKTQYLATFGEASVIPAGTYYAVMDVTATGFVVATGSRVFTGTDNEIAVESLENSVAEIPAAMNAEVLDVLTVDTFSELAAPPAATSSIKDKLTWLFMWARNKATESTTQRKLYADDGTTVVSTEAMSDTAGTFTKGEQV